MKAVSDQAESYCVYVKPRKITQLMHDIIPYMVDCSADTVVHLLLLKSSMPIVEDRQLLSLENMVHRYFGIAKTSNFCEA